MGFSIYDIMFVFPKSSHKFSIIMLVITDLTPFAISIQSLMFHAAAYKCTYMAVELLISLYFHSILYESVHSSVTKRL